MTTLAEQLGQLMIVGVDGENFDRDTESFFGRIRPGGVIFFNRNIASSQQFQRLVQEIRDWCERTHGAPPYLAIDLEGGTVDRLRGILAPLPSARDAAQADLGEALGRMAGREVVAFSLNVDFAPVLDLRSAASETVMGSRTVGKSSMEVVEFARGFLKGLAASGVIGCGKHFPGLGGGTKDSHKELPVVEKSEVQMWEEDLAPFRALAAELPMIMAAHVFCPALIGRGGWDGESSASQIPSTLSREVITGLLKERMGYRGLVICDDLEMQGVLQGRTMEEAAAAALKAGCDVLLLCGATGNTQRVFEALLAEANADAEFRRVVESAAEKIRLAKQRTNIARATGGAQEPDFDALRREIEGLSEEVRRRQEASAGKAGEGQKF